MTKFRRLMPAFLLVATTLLLAPAHAETQRAEIESIVREYLTSHPEEVQRLVREYLIKNPEVLQDALTALITRRAPIAAGRSAAAGPDLRAAIQSNAQALRESPHQVVLGNPSGTVTLVEFFDYNCGYCRRALGDMLALLQDEGDLRIVLKELPVLGASSVEAAGVSIAVRMQDPTGHKYLAFHRRLLGDGGRADRASALAVARDLGLDMVRLEQDLSSDEIRQTLEESIKLARAVGINGTPGYVVGDTVIPGAIGTAGLKEKIAAARSAAR